MKRKDFLKKTSTLTGILALGSFPFEAFAKQTEQIQLTILHTNDQHSRIDPFPMDGSKNQGLGGFAKRASIIEAFRKQKKNLLLLDSGDIFQGTPYFNKYHGELEIKLMNEMGYDAATIGNHDFDGGLENLRERMKQAKFPFLNANYNVQDTPLHEQMSTHKIFSFEQLKIGVFGVGIELDGLVPKNLYGKTVYENPLTKANQTALFLKKEKKCDYVICLSHLGFKYEHEKISDEVLATSSKNIDLILGGHTHTFFSKPKEYKNVDNKTVLVNQVGWAGICLGHIDLYFDKQKQSIHSQTKAIQVN